jgi:hypothetical protein
MHSITMDIMDITPNEKYKHRPPMDPALKAEWVRALRSGQYQQAKGYLVRKFRDDNGATSHCCLGVLCVLRELPVQYDMGGQARGFALPDEPQHLANSLLTATMQERWHVWIDTNLLPDGLKLPPLQTMDVNVTIGGIPLHVTYPSLNDAGFTFDQIADIIEWNITI